MTPFDDIRCEIIDSDAVTLQRESADQGDDSILTPFLLSPIYIG